MSGEPTANIKIPSSLQSKIIWLALWCSIAAFLAGLFRLWIKSIDIQTGAGFIQNLNWEQFANLADTIYVKRELASAGCLIAIILLIIHWLRWESGRSQNIAQLRRNKVRNFLLFSLTLLWILFQSLNSHASAFNEFSLPRVLAYAFHLLGAGMWIGGQIALIFFIAPRLRNPNEHYGLAREIYIRFGGIAATGVAILIITGIYNGGQQVASLDALLVTAYGQALLLKIVLVMLAGLIGLSHASHFHPRVAAVIHKLLPPRAARIIFGEANPASTLRLELLGGVAIFGLAAFLGSTQPARGPEFEPPVQASVESEQSFSSSGMADDLLVNLSIKPNQPGRNFITVGVFDTRRPSPGPVDEVVVKLDPPGEAGEIQLTVPASESDAAGNYQISTDDIQLSGDWTVSVVAHRAGWEDAVLELPWSVTPSAPTVISRRILISSRPLAPVFTTASLLLSVLCGGLLLLMNLRPHLFRGEESKSSVPQKK